MTRTELEHIIRAVAAITNENELIVIGSNVFRAHPEVPSPYYERAEAA